MIGSRIGHYRITAKLGAGGMGEVFQATDTRLGREVALKVLPADMASNPERLNRFRREAKALAALDHPGIVTVFSVEESNAVHFLTMQLVKGRTLESLLPEHGFGRERYFELALELADALASAHERGVIHRDLKPANAMVNDDGRLKILDFGLAKIAVPAETGDSEDPTLAQTREGAVMGTVPYMSPEQLAGRVVDHRSDIFSLGIILHEMACGERPFRGGSPAELASAILRDRPRPISQVRDDLPEGLDAVVARCLEKNVEDRFQAARELHQALAKLREEPASGRRPPPSGSAAVRAVEGFWVAALPFRYRGTDTEIAALAEGLSEEIVTGLSRFSYLRVIARSSTLKYANEAYDVRTVGTDLGARYVLEGSLRQAGSRLRIAAQAVDAITGAHLWAETYTRTFRPEDVFELQDEIVPRIVSTVADLHGVIPRTISEILRGKRPAELSPYEAVLRSFGYLERISAAEHAEVRDCLEEAIRKAPDDADLLASLSMSCADEYKHGFNSRPNPLDRALDAARRAVQSAPSNHLAYHVLAQALFFRGEFEDFRLAAERAVALNPMDGDTVAFMGILMAYAVDWEHGVAIADEALSLNPHHPGWYRFASVMNAYRKGDYRAALDLAQKMNMPSYFATHAALAAAYGQLGEKEAARRAVGELLAQKPGFAEAARDEFAKWWGRSELLERFIEGLRKAGLVIPDADDTGG